ncbi:MAG: DMT family transporter [Prolixibacteraceae bacterium]|nr:DMT family transporter [Prolixibacteraceae bacterium]NLX29980.1 DMT family transporter [Bacteroidales bacterium]HNQ38285.1 DMT family transporter [Prolixibacteraceae bacterium]HPJ78992.1 DMT family transporter [Prolixibacteraceae bacterium]HRV88294.1 DMT family transporter [Prolixibacteraceae bacterium]
MSYTGEISALLTALFWTVTSLSFEAAGKRVGSLQVNLIRLVIAFFIYAVYLKITRGMFLPVDAGAERWLWLSLSGLVGFVIGDLLLFQAFVVVGARISMLIMSLSPPVTALISWLMLGEVLSPMNWLGMAVTLTGISLVVLKREKGSGMALRKITTAYSLKGVLLAFGGAVGQAAGLVLSKKGMGSYDAFASSQIRVITGMAGFLLIILAMRRWPRVVRAVKNKPAMGFISLGSLFGPFLGVSFSLLAVQHTRAGIAATIMAIVPVLIIPPAVLIFRERVNWKEITGAVITVAGVMLFFL